MYKTKIKQLMTIPRLFSLACLCLLVALSVVSPLKAQTVTQGYGSDEQLQRGMIIRLKKEDSTKVLPLTLEKIEDMHGVVVDSQDAPVTLSSEGQRFFVATTGHFDVMVSTQNGPIAAGDYITISALGGIGMKAGTAEPVVVGRALASFDGKTNSQGSSKVKDSTGAEIAVTIGRVKVDITVAKNPLLKAAEPNVPEFLRKAASTVGGKAVPAIRIYLGLAILIMSSIVAGSLLFSGVKSAIISIGRNPLSKKSIVKGMIQVVITALIIFILGIFGVYLLLKL